MSQSPEGNELARTERVCSLSGGWLMPTGRPPRQLSLCGGAEQRARDASRPQPQARAVTTQLQHVTRSAPSSSSCSCPARTLHGYPPRLTRRTTVSTFCCHGRRRRLGGSDPISIRRLTYAVPVLRPGPRICGSLRRLLQLCVCVLDRYMDERLRALLKRNGTGRDGESGIFHRGSNREAVGPWTDRTGHTTLYCSSLPADVPVRPAGMNGIGQERRRRGGGGDHVVAPMQLA
jgi:hypothetical protein